MTELELEPAGAVAMLQGLLGRGAGSRLHLLNSAGETLAVVVLGSPCGEIVGQALVLAQEDEAGDLIGQTGSAVQASWYSYDNVLLASGAVSDEAGAGPFKLSGTSGTLMLAGGRAVLGLTALT